MHTSSSFSERPVHPQIMSGKYVCSLLDCGKVFSKAFELKKHTATHEEPDSVWHCPQCDFITLQKKNLRIHFAIHTGEKLHRCPDTINESTAERCKYRTNDPAALTKHRKRVHKYIPPPNRSRPRKVGAVTSRQPKQKDKEITRCPSPSQHPFSVSNHDPLPVPEGVDFANSGTVYPFTFSAASQDPCASSWRGNTEIYGQSSMVPSSYSISDSSISTDALFVAPNQEMDLNELYDPSLEPEWMSNYEMSYSLFDVTGMKYLPHPLPAVAPPDPDSLVVQTGREGCLCPDWMVEAGIEGWNQSVLDTYQRF